MNIEYLKQIRKNLEKEYNENCLKIDDLNKKIRLMNAYDLEKRVVAAMIFSLVPAIASMGIMRVIPNFGIIPQNFILPLSFLTNALVGITIEELLVKKMNISKRLKEFSKSKKQKEKIEELTRYEIEREKLINLNKTLEKGYDDLLEKENTIISLLKNYNVTEKDDDIKTTQEITKTIENINEDLLKQQKSIDIMSKKYVLKNKFCLFENRIKEIIYNLSKSLFGGGFCFAIWVFPMTAINELYNISTQISLIGFLSPIIVGTLVCEAYYIKKQIDYKAVFESINKELKDDAVQACEEENYDNKLENIIDHACELRLQLETEKQKLENKNKEKLKMNDEYLEEIIDGIFERTEIETETPVARKLDNENKEKLKFNDEFLDEIIDGILEGTEMETETPVARKLELINNKKGL